MYKIIILLISAVSLDLFSMATPHQLTLEQNQIFNQLHRDTRQKLNMMTWNQKIATLNDIIQEIRQTHRQLQQQHALGAGIRADIDPLNIHDVRRHMAYRNRVLMHIDQVNDIGQPNPVQQKLTFD